jgi:hypothetical protein
VNILSSHFVLCGICYFYVKLYAILRFAFVNVSPYSATSVYMTSQGEEKVVWHVERHGYADSCNHR